MNNSFIKDVGGIGVEEGCIFKLRVEGVICVVLWRRKILCYVESVFFWLSMGVKMGLGWEGKRGFMGYGFREVSGF